MTMTPGPWQIDEQSNGHFSIWASDERDNGELIATVYDEVDTSLAIANASAIAAVPNLVHALRDSQEKIKDLITVCIHNGLANEYAEDDWLIVSRDALAMAGEESK